MENQDYKMGFSFKCEKKKASKRINEDAREKSGQIGKFRFVITCKINVLNLPHSSNSM